MSRWGRTVLGILGVSVGVQVVLVFTTRGQPFDLASYQLVDGWLRSDPWHVYSLGTATHDVRWPYPPGFFPVDDAAVRIAAHAHLEFIRVIRLFLVAGDLLLCGLAWWWLRPRMGEAKAALGVGLIALGPSVVLVSANYGQLDAVAWIPAVAALIVWQGDRVRNRALVAGLLIGVGIATKIVPGIVLLALVPSARDRREAITATVSAFAVPLLLLAPFVAADPTGVRRALGYHGLPGFGGMSLLVQPSYIRYWLREDVAGFAPTGLSADVQHIATPLTLIAVAITFVVLWRRHSGAPQAMVALLLAFYACGVNFTPNYGVWGCVLLVFAGRLGWAAVLEVVLLVPTLMVNAAGFVNNDWPVWSVYGVYVPIMLGLWFATIGCWVAVLRRDLAVPAALGRRAAGRAV